jgi:hypothetical protein
MRARKTTKRRSAGQERKLDSKPRLAQFTPEFSKVVSSFADQRDVRLSKMFTSSSVLNVNGKIFAMCRKGELVVKLPKERVDELVARRKGQRFDPGRGRTMKEWIVVPPGKEDWLRIAKEGYEFVKHGISREEY